jgi:uncharacterized radical SAM protein YgiQ
MFIPTTSNEVKNMRWNELDVILVSGDTYIDSPSDGIVLIGKVLLNAGFKVGIIAQPDLNSGIDIMRLGEPKLFWGISAGCVDSMVANYTALLKKKHNDDLTPGGLNNKRPDRATIVYTNLIKRYFKNTAPIILGGIEASLRRIAHYDYWSNSIRRSVLFDAKADAIVYGMGEKTILEIADKMKNGENWFDTRGVCYISNKLPDTKFVELPPFNEVVADKNKFIEMFKTFYNNNEDINSQTLIQKYENRYWIQNPTQYLPTTEEIDGYYKLNFERKPHPYYQRQGKIKALETIQFSITSHRGCYAECNFCSITVHQGKRIVSRSEQSIIDEVKLLTQHQDFKGYISDIGGPTANMYKNACKAKINKPMCSNKKCIFPDVCKAMEINHQSQISLLQKVRQISEIKKIFIASGVRYDLVIEDTQNGEKYLSDIIAHHISGQMKIAPEHISENTLKLMGKNSKYLVQFKKEFDKINKLQGKKQFLTYYFIAAHPGCQERDMHELSIFLKKELKLLPEQVQIFTPTPSTYSTLMYYTEIDPFTGEKIFVEKSLKNKKEQKEIIVKKYQ